MKKILYLFFTCSIIFLLLQDAALQRKILLKLPQHRKLPTTTSTTENTTDSFYSDSDAKNDSYDFQLIKRIKNSLKVNNAVSSSNASVNENVYTLKKELDVVDDELDHLDDEFEHAYESGKLSFKVYKSREKTIEKIEDQLDLLEDALENKFGIDD